MKKLKVKRSQRKLTADWHNEIRSHITDVIKHRLVDTDILLHPQASNQKKKPKETFCTGSTYDGQWDYLGFAGHGTYTFPHATKYEGDFWDGQFHGNGTITYPGGQQLIGTWKQGKLMEWSYKFIDGLQFGKYLNYCQLPDRRFQIEKDAKLQPPEKELLTNCQPTRELPKNCYDTVDGYYNPTTKLVYGYDNRILRVVTVEEDKYIKDKYRHETDKPATNIEGLYKYWTSGRKNEIEKLKGVIEKKEIKSEDTITESSTQKSMSVYSFHIGTH
ncbi:MORN repeat-containing protein 5-like [Leptinotarsa decemlineata]|uniref:MORN repeat-containing protein 5-like n=1 Tax=Leptinotarsa decemlineata TaxID=7539 RepID=UPI003D30BFF0